MGGDGTASLVLAPYLTDVGEGELYVEAEGMPALVNICRMARLEPMEGGRLVLRPFPTNASRRLAIDVDGIKVAPGLVSTLTYA